MEGDPGVVCCREEVEDGQGNVKKLSCSHNEPVLKHLVIHWHFFWLAEFFGGVGPGFGWMRMRAGRWPKPRFFFADVVHLWSAGGGG